MTMCHANRVLTGTIALVAIGAAMAAEPAQADSVQNLNPAAIDVMRAAPQAPNAPAPAPAPQAMPTGNPLWTIPLSQLAVTRDRPIFSPSRRPPPPAVATPIYVPTAAPRVAKAEPERPPLILVGTIAGASDAIAVFVLQGTATTVRLHPNESHEGWVLRSVQGREATLQKGAMSSVLALAPPGGVPEPVTAQLSPEPPRKSRR
jgi:general secretion pathway protein N